MDLIAAQTPPTEDGQIHKHTSVRSERLNSPGILTISQNNKKVQMVAISCAFDLFLEESYCAKKRKYHSLFTAIENLGYQSVEWPSFWQRRSRSQAGGTWTLRWGAT